MKTETAPAKKSKSIMDLLFGRPLSYEQDRVERVAVAAGVAVFGLDALASAAYGPEAALTMLIPLGNLAPRFIVPISASIILLLALVYFSYRQTIAAYPGGGGSYTVASENLGVLPGLLAASALMIDYTLDCAVGISAGVGALVSAVPALQPHMLGLCLAILLMLTLVNLRGVRETGLAFMAPTYLFVGCLSIVICLGAVQSVLHAGHPTPVLPPPKHPPITTAVSVWLLLKAFASGCTALTGVEAVSNGVRAFQEPAVKTARRTLATIVATLMLLLGGIAYLVRAYGITATEPGKPGYQSVLSLLTQSVTGRGMFYYLTMASVMMVLALSANTAFADFPRVCRAVAENCYLPYPLTLYGRRLVYTPGILTLVTMTALLLIAFHGITDRLIPLFAVGAFLAFTLSQAGMVQHWRRTGGRGARSSMLINGIGAVATGITLCVIAAAKFTEGAWITILLIPMLIAMMLAIRRHYLYIQQQTANPSPLNLQGIRPPLVVVPIQHWSKISEKAIRFAYTLSNEIQAVHVDVNDSDVHGLRQSWGQLIEASSRKAGLTPPRLVVINSPYRFVLKPILEYILDLECQYPDRQIAVLVPELVERRLFYFFLHNQRANALKIMLYLRGNRRIVLINVPWYISEWNEEMRVEDGSFCRHDRPAA